MRTYTIILNLLCAYLSNRDYRLNFHDGCRTIPFVINFTDVIIYRRLAGCVYFVYAISLNIYRLTNAIGTYMYM